MPVLEGGEARNYVGIICDPWYIIYDNICARELHLSIYIVGSWKVICDAVWGKVVGK
jgi:hypothetical protein